MIIDEIQRVPELMLALKAAIDRDRRPGRFLLTGSANITTLPHIAESLAGRVELLTVRPLARCETELRPSGLSALLAGEPELRTALPDREELLVQAAVGGFPEVVQRKRASRRTQWFTSYAETTVIRGFRDILQGGDPGAILKILRMLALRSTGPRNVESMAHDSAIPATTLRRYLDILQTMFVIETVPAWFGNAEKRLVKHPKTLFVDSGLYRFFHGSATAAGPLLEMYAGCELQRLISMENEVMHLHHYRTHRGMEVDWVIEHQDGRVSGFEVKASASVADEDFRGLRDLAEAAGDRFASGTVLYCGSKIHRFGRQFLAVPLAQL